MTLKVLPASTSCGTITGKCVAGSGTGTGGCRMATGTVRSSSRQTAGGYVEVGLAARRNQREKSILQSPFVCAACGVASGKGRAIAQLQAAESLNSWGSHRLIHDSN